MRYIELKIIVEDPSLSEDDKRPYYDEYYDLDEKVWVSNEKQWEYQKFPLWLNLASIILLFQYLIDRLHAKLKNTSSNFLSFELFLNLINIGFSLYFLDLLWTSEIPMENTPYWYKGTLIGKVWWMG